MEPYCVHRAYGVCAPKRHRDMKILKFWKSAKKRNFRKVGFILFSSKFLRGQKFLCRGRGAQNFFPWESSNSWVFENLWFVGSTTSLCRAVGVFGKKGDLIIGQPLFGSYWQHLPLLWKYLILDFPLILDFLHSDDFTTLWSRLKSTYFLFFASISQIFCLFSIICLNIEVHS